MSHDHEELEVFLAGLPLAEPRAELDQRVLSALGRERPSGLVWAAAATLVIASLSVIVLLFPSSPAKSSIAPPPGPLNPPERREIPEILPQDPASPKAFEISDFQPSEIAGARRIGVVRGADQRAYYKVLVRRVRQLQWSEGPNGARFSIVRPVREVVYVPVPVD